jgi:hypothetical protein
MCGGKLGGWGFGKAMRYARDKECRQRRKWKSRRPKPISTQGVFSCTACRHMSNASSGRRCEPLCYCVDGRDNRGRLLDTPALRAAAVPSVRGCLSTQQPCASMRGAAPTATRECAYPWSHSRARALCPVRGRVGNTRFPRTGFRIAP